MSRTNKGAKPPGFDYWSKRPVKGTDSQGRASGFGPKVKKLTHRSERRQGKKVTNEEL